MLHAKSRKAELLPVSRHRRQVGNHQPQMRNLTRWTRGWGSSRPVHEAEVEFTLGPGVKVGISDVLALALKTYLLQHTHPECMHAVYFLGHFRLGLYLVHYGENAVPMLAQKVVPGVQLTFGRLDHFDLQISQMAGHLPSPHLYWLTVVLPRQLHVRVFVNIREPQLGPRLFCQVYVLYQPDDPVHRLIAGGDFRLAGKAEKTNESEKAEELHSDLPAVKKDCLTSEAGRYLLATY